MSAEDLFRRVLEELGFEGDPEMADTPSRFTGLLSEFRPSGPPPTLSTFPHQGLSPVVMRDLPFYSLCAHHLLPFFGMATVAYVPRGQVVGFGGIVRLLEHHARRPQLQERLAEQVASGLWESLSPRAVVVRLRARQLCMEMRGARSTGEIEVTASRGDVDLLPPL